MLNIGVKTINRSLKFNILTGAHDADSIGGPYEARFHDFGFESIEFVQGFGQIP